MISWSGPIALLSCYVVSRKKIVTQAGRPKYRHLWMGFLLSTLSHIVGITRKQQDRLVAWVKGTRKYQRVISFLTFYFRIHAFSISQTRLSRSLEEANYWGKRGHGAPQSRFTWLQHPALKVRGFPLNQLKPPGGVFGISSDGDDRRIFFG